MEERTSIIEAGEEVVNSYAETITVSAVELGRYGLLLGGVFKRSGRSFEGYLPSELAPVEYTTPWYGWCDYSTLSLPNGAAIGLLGLRRDDSRSTIEEYEAEWERTIEAMKAEEGVMQSRATEIRLN